MEIFNAILFLITFLCICLLVVKLNNKKKKQLYNNIIANTKGDLVMILNQINCESSTLGLKNRDYIFNKADVYILPDALILFGYWQNIFFKQLSVPIILTNHLEKYLFNYGVSKIVNPDKMNLNSFNGDVYFSFGEAGFFSTSVDIRLKGLSAGDKELINKALKTN